ncbi:MucBP domain-containing protein [Enterococcus termitis]|uniref:MucBP domain-containing protein n=1 Tax=Enterococcus termitis TaxID=332950 RepID=A0A1E5GB83_9ENTE|nr:MucBP domain-containing protein [Enterococcus termitis]OEG09958.1 hypothetical protein BCR25_10700 [Enterococcus termitis]OJG98481.1 hypothetical protein RV18_GL003382 [Enterococcus termitis]
MKKRKQKLNQKSKLQWLFMLLIVFVVGGYFFSQNKLRAFTIVTNGDFRLKAENLWNGEEKKSYASLEWGEVSGLKQSGYQLFQSEDGTTWNVRSMNYGKTINVLNVYPDRQDAQTLKEWMDSLNLEDSKGNQLIQVSYVSQTDLALNPNKYMKNAKGDYIYDVMMFGSWDYNNHKDISVSVKNATQEYINSGRGVLFGHDTITPNDRGHTNFNSFASQLGFKLQASSFQLGSRTVKINNNGYLMKYPFELQNDLTLTVPLTHTWGQGILPNSNTIKWLEFLPPYNWNKPGDGSADATFYLATNNNLGMIQTGHSNGQSTIDERKIIANTLYNLAQVSLETKAQDYTVKDDRPPKLATAIQKPNTGIENLAIEIDSVDIGKEYQWYVEADTRDNGLKKSDIVKEMITSNIAGYFYKIDSSSTSNLNSTVESYKDDFGRIAAERYDIYVAPQGTTDKSAPNYDPSKDANLLTYNTKGSITGINGLVDFDKYLHVVTVDRANNVSGVKTIQIKELMTEFRISEKYLDTEGKEIQQESYQNIKKGSRYTQSFKQIHGYAVDSYTIDNGTSVPSDSQTTVAIDKIAKHMTVTYYYNKLIQLNIRQIVLADHQEVVVPKSGYLQIDNGRADKKSNLFNLTVISGKEQEKVPYTERIIAKQANHHQLVLTALIPEYYSYSGYVATTDNRLHNSELRINNTPSLDITEAASYWVTIYIEPSVDKTRSPLPYSWDYQQNKLGEILRTN